MVFAWAHDGRAQNGWIEIQSDGVLATKWGDGIWSAAPGVPHRLDFSFGSARHVCHLSEGGRFEVVQHLRLKTGMEFHPKSNGVFITSAGWPTSLRPTARPLRREAPGTPEKVRGHKRTRSVANINVDDIFSKDSFGKAKPRIAQKREDPRAVSFGGSWIIEVDGKPWGKATVNASGAYFTFQNDRGQHIMPFQIQGDGSPRRPYSIADGRGLAQLFRHDEGVREWDLAHGGRSVWKLDEQASWCDTLDVDECASPMGRCLTRALAVLRPGAGDGRLPGRESEQAEIGNFLNDAICTGGRSQVLYVSGMPGTGKTASVLEAVSRLRRASDNSRCPKFTFVHVNGMCLSSPTSVFVDIAQQVQAQHHAFARTPASGCRAYEELTKLFSGSTLGTGTIVLLIDEIDCLVTQGQAVLYQLFEWLSFPNAHLALIAIANTMDLPERLLPRIASRLAVLRVNFAPYDRPQLRQIMTSRLWLANAEGAFMKDALEICAARVAAGSGDARKALQVCRRAIELVIDECSESDLCPVALRHVTAAEESLLRVNPASKSIKSLSLKAQRLLLALVLEVKKSENMLVPLRDALRRYAGIMSTCERRELGDSLIHQTVASFPNQHADDALFMLQRLEAMALLRVHCTGPWNDEAVAAQLEGCGSEVMLSLGESLDADDVAGALSGSLEDDVSGDFLSCSGDTTTESRVPAGVPTEPSTAVIS